MKAVLQQQCRITSIRQGRVNRQARARNVQVRADDGFCRDKIAFPVEKAEGVEGESTLVFLGANGQKVEVQAQKVRMSLTPRPKASDVSF